MSVFVDTSALYALLVETEEDHRAVLRSFEQLLRKGRSLFTTNYVVVESAALLQHRFGLAPIRDLVDRLLPVVTVRWVTETLHRRGLARLVARDGRQLSLVDCVSFEFMEEEGMQQALALDRHFEDEGFHTLPSQHQAMNHKTEAQLRADRLAHASRKVRDESMRVNAEFEAIEHDPDA